MKFPRLAAFLRSLADRLDSDIVATSIVIEPGTVSIYAAHPMVMTVPNNPDHTLELLPGDVLDLNFNAESAVKFEQPVLH